MNNKTSLQTKRFVYFFAIIFSIYGCAAPRSVTNTGKVTPHKQLRFGTNFSGNFSSAVASSLIDGAISTASDLIKEDTVKLEESIVVIEKTALSYSLDPIGSGWDFYVRYGLLKRVDIGYKFASGVHIFDAMYQFMGSTGTIDNPGKSGLNGSIGIQYATQSYDLPFGLNKVQRFLGFNLSRKDFLIPLIFSIPIGEEEKYGALSFGMAYHHASIKYGFNPENIYVRAANNTNLIPVEAISCSEKYSSYGLFLNIKGGYKFIYLITSFALYYQNYGKYQLLNDKTVSFSGLTFIPTIGLQFNIAKLPFLKEKGNSSKNSIDL